MINVDNETGFLGNPVRISMGWPRYRLNAIVTGLLLVAWFLISGCSQLGASKGEIHLVPWPTLVKPGNSNIDLTGGFHFSTTDPALRKLIPVLSDEIYLITGLKNSPGKGIPILLKINSKPGKEAYELNVGEQIVLEGNSYAAVAQGSVTMLQLIDSMNQIPEVEIKDSARFNYRGLEVDLARSWHDVASIEQLITLCRWYKIRYLQLHLSDDQSFTFPSEKYPLLPTEDRHYTKEQLKALDQYASERGVILVPEIEAPSHSSSLIKAMPGLFGIKALSKNNYTLNMGKEEVYQAFDTLIGELAETFPETPYIHIACDEVFGEGMEDDPDIRKYMQLHDLHSMEELYQHFIVRLNTLVKKHGKQSIVWSGFQKANAVTIPKDILVMEYETSNYSPQDLIRDGYHIINATFKPLYVVNNQRWDADYIYENWDPFKWEMPGNLPGKDEGIQIAPTPQVEGGSMSSWEQAEAKEIPSLRLRLGAMSERLWNSDKRATSDFMKDLTLTDKKFGRLMSPVLLEEQGRIYPGSYDGNFDEKLWFDSAITIQMKSVLPNLTLHYTMDGSYPGTHSPEYTRPLSFENHIQLRVQAYDQDTPVGFTLDHSYRLYPVHAVVKGIRTRRDMMPNSWEKAKFDDSVSIAFSSKTGKSIRYEIREEGKPLQAATYAGPLILHRSASVMGQLFDAEGKPVGQPFRQDFVHVKKEVSLTTGKPVTSSSDQLDNRLAKLVVDGEISDEDYWSDKVNGWIEIDLEKVEDIGSIKVYTYWDGDRYYQYQLEVSKDRVHWEKVVDFSHNTQVATQDGYVHDFPPVAARYIKITMLYNSSNSMMHLLEINAFGPGNLKHGR